MSGPRRSPRTAALPAVNYDEQVQDTTEEEQDPLLALSNMIAADQDGEEAPSLASSDVEPSEDGDSDGYSGSEDEDEDDEAEFDAYDFFEEEYEEEEDNEEEAEETTATTTTTTTADVQSNSLYYDPNEEEMDFEIEEIRSGLEQMDQDLKEMKSMSFKDPFDAQFIAKCDRILRNVDYVTSKFPKKSFQLGDVAGEIALDLDSITVMSKYIKDVFKLYDTEHNIIRWQMSPMIYLTSMTTSRVRVGVKDNPNVRK